MFQFLFHLWWKNLSYYNTLTTMHYLLYGKGIELKAPQFKVFNEKDIAKPNHYVSNIKRLKYRNKFLDN